jgi:hypothetical protein
VVNIVTKSGTNTLPGDVFEFFRNQQMTATTSSRSSRSTPARAIPLQA